MVNNKQSREESYIPGPEVIKLFSCSVQLSTIFILLINVKMPAIVGILIFISMINTTSERLKARNFFICRYFSFYEQLKFCAQLSWASKKFYNLGACIRPCRHKNCKVRNFREVLFSRNFAKRRNHSAISDVGRSCFSREFLTTKTCLLTLFAKKWFSRFFFLNLHSAIFEKALLWLLWFRFYKCG